MSKLFSPAKIGKLTLKNRFVRSASHEGLAKPDATPKKELSKLWQELAEGEVGLIITGYTAISKVGRQSQDMSAIYQDDAVEQYSEITKDVHSKGAKIAMQLVHVGGQIHSLENREAPVLAPSVVEHPAYKITPVAMSISELKNVINDFASGAKKAKDAGFDAVQLHAAHGYLLNQFLSPYMNRRSDEYGGSAANRRRIVLEVYKAVRQAVGADYPVFIKLNADDYFEGGLELEDSLALAILLEQEGLDAIEVSGGTPYSGKKNPSRMRIKEAHHEAYFQENLKVHCTPKTVNNFIA